MRAQGFLAKHEIDSKEIVDARAKLGRADALRLASAVSTVIVAKGGKVARFDMKKEPPGSETLLAQMLGPTGNLRAPTIRNGKTLLVGFNEEAYAVLLPGGKSTKDR